MESSPACWAVYGEILAREYSDLGYAAIHRLTVDTYAVQHPGRPSPQSIQSVAVHLISLHLVLERGYAMPRMPAVLTQAAVWGKKRFVWLDPPPSRGEITVADVQQAKTVEEHVSRVRAWAESAWKAWGGHHGTIRNWADSVVSGVQVRH